MDFVPHTLKEFQEMLAALNLESEMELFRSIPSQYLEPDISFPRSMTEREITQHMQTLSDMNRGARRVSFLGGGAYDHFVPHAVKALVSRGDFATAYTPYQPEISQGTLQSIYEFQTLMCRLTGMEVANASMYDGASALAEAALMACRITRKEKVAVSAGVNPHYQRVLHTYLDATGIECTDIPLSDGITDLDAFSSRIDSNYAAFFIQHPNYFGILEPVSRFKEKLPKEKCLLGAVVYPHSLGLLQPPGQWNADLVVGDLQSLGIPLQFGGPYAGFISCKNQYVRQLPGRLVGRTKDTDGKTGFVLTLQTREQHIRRAKATSNICTNQALCALMSTIYMALLGPKGLRQAAETGVRNAHVLQQRLTEIEGVELVFDQPFFNEFVIRLPIPVESFIDTARDLGLLPGIRVEPGKGLDQEGLLVCATEKIRAKDIDFYGDALTRILE